MMGFVSINGHTNTHTEEITAYNNVDVKTFVTLYVDYISQDGSSRQSSSPNSGNPTSITQSKKKKCRVLEHIKSIRTIHPKKHHLITI